MSERLPEFIEPLRLVDAGRTLRGWLPVSQMARLLPQLASPDARVEIDLHFDRNPDGLAVVEGTVSAVLSMICQRCLDEVSLQVQSEVALALVRDEASAERVPAQYEPLVVTGQPLHLAEFVEDEVLLALPIVAMHPPGQCAAQSPREPDEAAPEQPPENPFAVLAQLKDKVKD